MFPPQGLVAAALQPYSLVSLLLTPNVIANDQILNAAPTASTVTAANAKSFTGTIGQIALPAITPAANGSGITLTGLNFTQGAISNIADSQAITVKHIVMTFAAGAALETGVLTQTAIDITLANQAANAANNQATAIKITGGTLAGGASAYQRGIDITMAAATDTALRVGLGLTMLSGAATPPTPDTTLHVWNGTAGAVTAPAGSVITIENSGNAFLTCLAPTNAVTGIVCGDPANATQAAIKYYHPTHATLANILEFTISGGVRLRYTGASPGVFAFQAATIISTASGALTLQPQTANGVRFADSAEGGTGSMNIKTVRQVVALSGASTSTTINIPAGAMLLGASFNVDTAVVTSAATNTWDADFTGGSVTNLVPAGAAGAQNTKANKLIVPEIASAQTNIEFDAPGAETFSSGAIEVVAYYIDQTSLANA